MFTLYLFCFINLWLILVNFSKKLIVLLGFESFFLITLIYLYLFCSGIMNNFFILFFFTVFMVLDSVLGASFLVASTRNSSYLSSVNMLF